MKNITFKCDGVDPMTTRVSDPTLDTPTPPRDVLLPCPCGETPIKLLITAEHDTPKWAYCCGDCCNEWSVEYRNGYTSISSDEGVARAHEAWNEATRGRIERLSAGTGGEFEAAVSAYGLAEREWEAEVLCNDRASKVAELSKRVRDAKARVLAMIAATPPPSPDAAVREAWQPIETAPRDREVLVYRADAGVWLARWDEIPNDPDGECCWLSDVYGLHQGEETPTHWMPLPEPPK